MKKSVMPDPKLLFSYRSKKKPLKTRKCRKCKGTGGGVNGVDCKVCGGSGLIVVKKKK
jgi:DnaJ-class molecular chaperone